MHHSLRTTLTSARRARTHCHSVRASLVALSECHLRIQRTHAEIRRRYRLVNSLKSTLQHLHRVYELSKRIQLAQSNADHAELSRACILFESLTTAHPLSDPRYKCLDLISARVAHAAVQSTRVLRASLREACRNFERVEYVRCMREFESLSAGKQFAHHVLHVFREEGVAVYEGVLVGEVRPCQRVLRLVSELSELMNRLGDFVAFHVESLGDRADEVGREVGRELCAGEMPFDGFGRLVVALVGETRLALLGEQTKSLLNVFEAAQSFCELIKACDKSVEHSLCVLEKANGDKKEETTDAGYPRRKVSLSKLGNATDSLQRRRSGRALNGGIITEDIRKVVRALAFDCLSARHARHAEELHVITESPESWVRIRINERDMRSLLRDLFAGLDGRISKRVLGPDSTGRQLSDALETEYEDMSCASVTFTTASMAMLRWASEYATIGVTVPGAYADALSNITDIFLILVHASIDMRSRIRISASAPFLKVLEDIILERPQDKSIADFIPAEMKQAFEAFIDRYGSPGFRRAHDAYIGRSAERWGWSSPAQLPSYSRAVGQLFANSAFCTLSITRQCVAAEGMGTLCDVLEQFVIYLEEHVGSSKMFRESPWPLKAASLKSAIRLGRAVQGAFYELLAWDILGGWQAVSAVAETCRLIHQLSEPEKIETASTVSPFVNEMVSRIQRAYSMHSLPPAAAERISVVICETAMGIVLEGFSRVQHCTEAAGASQMLVDVRTLDLALVEHTGMHPCPGRTRTEMYVKATFLDEEEVTTWAQKHKRKLNLSDDHVKALIVGSRHEEVPIVDQIITP